MPAARKQNILVLAAWILTILFSVCVCKCNTKSLSALLTQFGIYLCLSLQLSALITVLVV